MPQERITDATEAIQRALFGPMDRHLRLVRERFGVRITARGDVLTLDGNDDDAVQDVLGRVKRVLTRLGKRGEPTPDEVEDLLLGDGRFEDGPRPEPRGARATTGPRQRQADPAPTGLRRACRRRRPWGERDGREPRR